MFLNSSFFGFEAVPHERYEVSDDGPVPTGSECPEKGRVCAGEVVVFESLSQYVVSGTWERCTLGEEAHPSNIVVDNLPSWQ